jgi:hypothetical protein
MPHGVGHRLTLAEREAVIDGYMEGISSEKLALDFGVSGVAIRKTLQRAGVERRDARECHRTCELDETVFDTLTPESAYWVGMLMSDGYLTEEGLSVNMRLQIGDKAHVEKLQAFLKSTHAVRLNKAATSVGLSVKSPKLYAALQSYGVRPNKSFTAEVAPVLAHNRDFWRGIADGDGSLKNYGGCPRLHLIGSQGTIRQFDEFCAPYLDGYPLKIQICKHSPIWNATMYGNAAMTMMRVLYKSAVVYLDRKKTFADEMAALYKGRTFRVFKKFARLSTSSPAPL